MNLFVDDVREAGLGWTVVRTYDEAWTAITTNFDNINVISLDHDLGEDRSGYDLLCKIEELVRQRGPTSYVPIIRVHSANPVGVDRMRAAIAAIDRYLTPSDDHEQ